MKPFKQKNNLNMLADLHLSTLYNPSTQVTGRYTEGGKSFGNSSFNHTMFYENEFGTVRSNNKSSFKMMPGKKKRRAYSVMGQKTIVLNPHCKDN